MKGFQKLIIFKFISEVIGRVKFFFTIISTNIKIICNKIDLLRLKKEEQYIKLYFKYLPKYLKELRKTDLKEIRMN